MLYGILIGLQMIISILLVVSILLQNAKGGGLAGIAGGMMSSAVFGGRSAANFLSKATTILAALFMFNCVGMAVLSTTAQTTTSVTQQSAKTSPANSPVPSSEAPADAPAQPSDAPATPLPPTAK
jgi:preprotein translocase subunit SecG